MFDLHSYFICLCTWGHIKFIRPKRVVSEKIVDALLQGSGCEPLSPTLLEPSSTFHCTRDCPSSLPKEYCCKTSGENCGLEANTPCRQSSRVGFVEGRIEGTEDRETCLPLQKNRRKKEGAWGEHLCLKETFVPVYRQGPACLAQNGGSLCKVPKGQGQSKPGC